jgi:hypothetical protein
MTFRRDRFLLVMGKRICWLAGVHIYLHPHPVRASFQNKYWIVNCIVKMYILNINKGVHTLQLHIHTIAIQFVRPLKNHHEQVIKTHDYDAMPVALLPFPESTPSRPHSLPQVVSAASTSHLLAGCSSRRERVACPPGTGTALYLRGNLGTKP